MATCSRELELLTVKALEEAAACLKVMAHPVRLRIVDILMQDELSVGEIAAICDVQPNQVCEHLRHMQDWGLLTSERRGRSVYYKISSPRLPSLINCVRMHCGAGELTTLTRKGQDGND